eukprot:TRINITY_DN12122_c0_g1_i1.p1 TRINITY_DN12122_c0_g1~~TRINITY_DN12122_c0_g1_i1.p1  ORF type:complete len:812 (+),score=244.21 TRINITY_DN12122_c0_g1_i1:227-2662(+)
MSGTVLVLGCGLVAPPLIKYLANNGCIVKVASRTLEKSVKVIQDMGNTSVPIEAFAYDVDSDIKNDLSELESLIQKLNPDVIVSLLPYIYHVPAAKLALKFKKHFCTTSYVSPAMAELDSQVKAAGLTFLNECGVDPGLDHMSAMKVIDQIRKEGGKLVGFTSICGGLPAPQFNDNPFGYKLSWSPRGVLLASNNSALIRKNGDDIAVAGLELFEEKNVNLETVEGVGELEWYYNRDSVMYADIYNIQDTDTIIRGTYRFRGWCKTLNALKNLGFTNSTENEILSGFSNASAQRFCAHVLDVPVGSNLQAAFAAKAHLPVDDLVIRNLEWLGVFSGDVVIPRASTALDFMCFLFQRSLIYKEGEKDMIVMRHTFEVDYGNGKRVTKRSTLIDYGLQPEGYSSMARTVSLPLAVAIKAIFEGKIRTTGVLRPVTPEIYSLILEEMERLGVVFKEETLTQTIWIRAEVKEGERRVPITPRDARQLVEFGYNVVVEKSVMRAFEDEEYKEAGATLVEAGSWVDAPNSAIVLGLKELPEDFPQKLHHRHIYFAHCYKNQDGWKELLSRFARGGGLVWDLEFLVDEHGRRIAAFGRAAGIVGAALGILNWAVKVLGEPMPPLTYWQSSEALVRDVRSYVERAMDVAGRSPAVLVLGALGRCGGGASWFTEMTGINPIKWDLEETRNGGPFNQLLEVDVLVNCIYLSNKIPPFLTEDMLAGSGVRLSVFVDVSCDYNNPANPFPIYSQSTSLKDPVLQMSYGKNSLSIISIDHLPTLIPSESSAEFSSALIKHMNNLQSPVWTRAENLYQDMVARLT